MADPNGVFIAMGMVTAPFAALRRQQVRETMLQYEPVLARRMAFRFVVGDSIHHATGAAPSSTRLLEAELRREVRTHGDIVQLDAMDGGGIEVACSCVEKLTSWVRYALKTWPSARFIGKTEDDTYVQLHVLEAELLALVDQPNLLLGYMTLAVLPTRPTRFEERSPKKACVTLINECQKDARNRRKPYTEGCFLGDLESKLEVPAKLRADLTERPSLSSSLLGLRASAHRKKALVSADSEPSPLIGWWRGAVRDCGMAAERTPTNRKVARALRRQAALRNPNASASFAAAASWRGFGRSIRDGASSSAALEADGASAAAAVAGTSAADADAEQSTMAPFPTGPLNVFGRDLARSLFVECPYQQAYEKDARYWGRRSLCKGKHAPLSFASTLCDTVLSHWLGKCGMDVTVAHTTRTKSHHYMWRGAGLGWMPPSNISLAVHYLKAKPDVPSGPNRTVGGEWAHVHSTVRHSTRAAFPNLLYRMGGGYSLNVTASRRLLRSLSPEVFHWYASECSFEHVDLRRAVRPFAAAN